MIGYLEGTVVCRDSNGFIVQANGVGYKVIDASRYCLQFKQGDQVQVFTYLNVKEDALQLFGFASQEEKFIFEKLIGVSKVGPKIAATILTAFTVDQIVNHIAGRNIQMLATVPGLGKKTAERIILELKDKIGSAIHLETDEGSAVSEAKEALVALGYSQTEAMAALKESGEHAPVEQMIKEALSRMVK